MLLLLRIDKEKIFLIEYKEVGELNLELNQKLMKQKVELEHWTGSTGAFILFSLWSSAAGHESIISSSLLFLHGIRDAEAVWLHERQHFRCCCSTEKFCLNNTQLFSLLNSDCQNPSPSPVSPVSPKSFNSQILSLWFYRSWTWLTFRGTTTILPSIN